MANTFEAGIFDIDGTIRTKAGISDTVIDGFKHIQEAGVKTTIITGRGYARALEAFGNNWSKLVTANTPVGVENAGRVTSFAGDSNLHYAPLSTEEQTSSLYLATRFPELPFIAYFPEDIKRKAVMWSQNGDLDELTTKYGHFADITKGTVEELAKMMQQDKPCMLNVPGVEGLMEEIPAGLNSTYNEGVLNINAESVDKGFGVTAIANLLGVDLAKVFIAGNDHNDEPMYALNVGRKIFVQGNEAMEKILPPETVIIASPEELGKYLQQY